MVPVEVVVVEVVLVVVVIVIALSLLSTDYLNMLLPFSKLNISNNEYRYLYIAYNL